jgi:hypothetical protein
LLVRPDPFLIHAMEAIHIKKQSSKEQEELSGKLVVSESLQYSPTF